MLNTARKTREEREERERDRETERRERESGERERGREGDNILMSSPSFPLVMSPKITSLNTTISERGKRKGVD